MKAGPLGKCCREWSKVTMLVAMKRSSTVFYVVVPFESDTIILMSTAIRIDGVGDQVEAFTTAVFMFQSGDDKIGSTAERAGLYSEREFNGVILIGVGIGKATE